MFSCCSKPSVAADADLSTKEEDGAHVAHPQPQCCLMMYEVKDFADWHQGFVAHGTSKTFTVGGKEFTVEMERSACCADAKTLVFQHEVNPNIVAIHMSAVDFAKMGSMMSSDTFKEMSALTVVSQAAPLGMKPLAPDACQTPNFFWVEAEDPDTWIAEFKARSTSKTPEALGEAPGGGFQTLVFKCQTNPKLVGIYVEKAPAMKEEAMKLFKAWPNMSSEQKIALGRDVIIFNQVADNDYFSHHNWVLGRDAQDAEFLVIAAFAYDMGYGSAVVDFSEGDFSGGECQPSGGGGSNLPVPNGGAVEAADDLADMSEVFGM